jgi:hypothetical protein
MEASVKLHAPDASALCPLNMRLGGSQHASRGFGKEKNLFSLPESNQVQPSPHWLKRNVK